MHHLPRTEGLRVVSAVPPLLTACVCTALPAQVRDVYSPTCPSPAGADCVTV